MPCRGQFNLLCFTIYLYLVAAKHICCLVIKSPLLVYLVARVARWFKPFLYPHIMGPIRLVAMTANLLSKNEKRSLSLFFWVLLSLSCTWAQVYIESETAMQPWVSQHRWKWKLIGTLWHYMQLYEMGWISMDKAVCGGPTCTALSIGTILWDA